MKAKTRGVPGDSELREKNVEKERSCSSKKAARIRTEKRERRKRKEGTEASSKEEQDES